MMLCRILKYLWFNELLKIRHDLEDSILLVSNIESYVRSNIYEVYFCNFLRLSKIKKEKNDHQIKIFKTLLGTSQ